MQFLRERGPGGFGVPQHEASVHHRGSPHLSDRVHRDRPEQMREALAALDGLDAYARAVSRQDVPIQLEHHERLGVVAKGLDPDKTPLSAVMTEKLLTATADKPLSHALHMMFEGGFRHVPVVENGKPVGMVSARNALGLEICQFEKELKERDHIAEIL